MYSQRDEEKYILSNLPATGRFLDIGAYNGKTFSNTLALVEKGWKGVCVEPSPEAFVQLLQLHRSNNNITLVNALAGFNWCLRKFHSSADAVATSEQSNYDKWKKNAAFREIFIPELPISELIRVHPGPYDFVNIDTEGSSWPLLQSIDLKAMNVKLLCVEFDSFFGAVTKHLESLGFKTIYHNSENILAKRD